MFQINITFYILLPVLQYTKHLTQCGFLGSANKICLIFNINSFNGTSVEIFPSVIIIAVVCNYISFTMSGLASYPNNRSQHATMVVTREVAHRNHVRRAHARLNVHMCINCVIYEETLTHRDNDVSSWYCVKFICSQR